LLRRPSRGKSANLVLDEAEVCQLLVAHLTREALGVPRSLHRLQKQSQNVINKIKYGTDKTVRRGTYSTSQNEELIIFFLLVCHVNVPSGACLSGVCLSISYLLRACLAGAFLPGACWQVAYLLGTRYSSAKCLSANFLSARCLTARCLSAGCLSARYLSARYHTCFQKLVCQVLAGCLRYLLGACLPVAYLLGACLPIAYLSGACLPAAYMPGACMQLAYLLYDFLPGVCLLVSYLLGASLPGAC
jgi:hypothetical protein